MKKKIIKKYKQAARREVREKMKEFDQLSQKHADALEYEHFIQKFIKNKPRYLPFGVWIWLIRTVIKSKNEVN